MAARDVLAELPTRVVAGRRWARALVLFGAGALTTLGLPPADIWPIAFLTLPVLLWHLEGRDDPLVRVSDGMVVRFRVFRDRFVLDLQRAARLFR